MSEPQLDHEDLLKIVALGLASPQFSELHLRSGEIEIDLRKGVAEAVAMPGPEAAPQQPGPGAIAVKSELVGIFRRAPGPDAAPYVQIGSEVTAETTIGVVEVLASRRPICAGVAGIVAAIPVADAAPVEFGQVLAVIEPLA